MKKIGGIFAFKVKNGPNGKEATWVVDVKNGKGSVLPNSGQCCLPTTSPTGALARPQREDGSIYLDIPITAMWLQRESQAG